MRKSRQGVEMSVQAIVITVLAIIVLVVVLMVFSGQIRKAIFGYTDISNRTMGETRGENCGSIFSDDRKCVSGGCPQGYSPVAGEWKDCGTEKSCCARE